jgi:SRSO17 transposase
MKVSSFMSWRCAPTAAFGWNVPKSPFPSGAARDASLPKNKSSMKALRFVPIPALVAAWPESRWQRLQVGRRRERSSPLRLGLSAHGREPRPTARSRWLASGAPLAHDAEDLAYYLSNAPAETDLLTLAQVASTRYTVEQCIEEAKGETGLDHYEVRYWHSWHRHITLSMMAHAWLASVRLGRNRKKGGPSPFSLN